MIRPPQFNFCSALGEGNDGTVAVQLLAQRDVVGVQCRDDGGGGVDLPA
jgi:hypothetical protein